MSRSAFLFRRGLFLLCGAAVLLLAGCGEGDRFSYATEGDEPAYRDAQAYLKSGRRQEALASFLKVISKRGDDAPESHLEVGLLYASHISDPIAAIYHFKKYLALRPNSQQAPLVKQRIDAAIREFARTLPAQPLDSTVQRVDLIAELDKVKLENEILKQQVSDLKAGREATSTDQPGAEPAATGRGVGEAPAARSAASVTSAADGNFAFNVEPMPVVRTRGTTPPPPAPAPTPVAPSAAKGKPAKVHAPTTPAPDTAKKPTAPAQGGGGKHHVVKPGDTLFKLAQQYYGTRSKWRDIYNANRKVMRNEGDLHAGMDLVIP